MGIDQLKDRCRGCGAILQRRRSCEACAGNQRARLHAAGVAVAEGGWRQLAPHLKATMGYERDAQRYPSARDPLELLRGLVREKMEKQEAFIAPQRRRLAEGAALVALFRYLSLFAKPHEVGIDNCVCWQCERQRWAHIPRTDELPPRREYFCTDETGNPVRSWPQVQLPDDQSVRVPVRRPDGFFELVDRDKAAWDAAFNAELAPDLQRRKALRDQLAAPPRLQELADARARQRP